MWFKILSKTKSKIMARTKTTDPKKLSKQVKMGIKYEVFDVIPEKECSQIAKEAVAKIYKKRLKNL